MSRLSLKARNLLLLAGVALLVIGPLVMHQPQPGVEIFTGSDDQATAAIAQNAPGYQPWFAPFWTPPSKEIESLIFALQAALGTGILGYYLGRRKALSEMRQRGGGVDAAD